MNFKNIYIHEGRLFVCFVPMVHETKVMMTQGKLLNLSFGQSIRIFVRNDILRGMLIKVCVCVVLSYACKFEFLKVSIIFFCHSP